MYISTVRMLEIWFDNLPKLLEEGNIVTDLVHSLSSNLKAFTSWFAQETIFECRQACGSNGYLQYAMFGKLEEINDLNMTWEGDNNVLLMQVQNYLLKNLRAKMEGQELVETLEFISTEKPEFSTFDGDVSDIPALVKLFDDKANFHLHEAAELLLSDPSTAKDVFQELQPFELRDLCRAYFDRFNSDRFRIFLERVEDEKSKAVLEKVFLLYLQYTILQQAEFYDRIFTPDQMEEMQKSLMTLCADLRPELYQLTRVFPFPNNVFGALGNEDLQVYKRLKVFRENVG